MRLPRCCQICGQFTTPDKDARFWSQSKEVYGARQSKRLSNSCCSKTPWMVPVNRNVPWIRGSMKYLSARPKHGGHLRPGIESHLLPADQAPYWLPESVRTKHLSWSRTARGAPPKVDQRQPPILLCKSVPLQMPLWREKDFLHTGRSRDLMENEENVEGQTVWVITLTS